MLDTIKAQNGYHVVTTPWKIQAEAKEPDLIVGKLYDGNQLLLIAQFKTMEEYDDEYRKGNNACAVRHDVLTTESGEQFIHWGDLETGEDFLTIVHKGGKRNG